MVARDLIDREIKNEQSYDDLLVAIEASDDILSLLIAACDDDDLREQIIKRYETELEPDIRCYRLTLARQKPSLKAAITQLVQSDEYLQSGGRAVLTITGAEQLYFLKLGAKRSEQEIFFGYLQWTREALREFPYPIVLWVTNQMLVNLSKKAPDFWSWRKGVFRFVSKKTAAIPSTEVASLSLVLDDDDPHFLPIEDLQALIEQTEQQRGAKDLNLATLYDRMGQIYQRRLERGEFQEYKMEQALAIKYFCKAVELQKELGLEIDLATTLNNLALVYVDRGRYQEAETLLVQALELRQRLLGEEHPDVATGFNNLATLFKYQGRYQEAEPLYIRALELRQRLSGEETLDIASSLNNLATLYDDQGRYQEAEPLYVRALELRQRLLGEETLDIATSYNSLAGLYESQGRYNEAEPLYQQALALYQRLLGEEHPAVATGYNNLALLYKSQGRYNEAEPLYQQALALHQRLLGEEHPAVATIYNNLANLYKSQGRYSEAEPLYQQALALRQRLLGEEHPDVANSYNNLAGLYYAQGRYSEAEPLYQQALEIREQRLGVNHPNTIHVSRSLEILHAALDSEAED